MKRKRHAQQRRVNRSRPVFFESRYGIQYPTRDGVAIDPNELEFGASHLNPNNKNNYNNHHGEFQARLFGGNILFLTFRNLEANQYPMLLDTHAELHQTYDAPKFPTPFQARDFIEQQRELGGNLRLGSQNHPTYRPIEDFMAAVDRAYESVGGREEKKLIDMGAR